MSVGTIDDGAAHAAAAGGAGAAAASPPRPSLRRPLTPLPPLVEAGPHAPNPPLIMADRRFEFVPVPPETGFAGYWVRDALRSTPPPLPFDTALGCSRLVARAHETVPGVLVLETPTTWSIVVKPDSIPLGPLSRYVETFRKDGATSAWKLRRDLMLTGKSQGQLYFTSCGTLILRSFAKGMFGGDDFTCEDYIRMEDEGNAVVLRQCVTHLASGRAGVQYMIGAWGGERGPPGY
ncbi:MAG: hypothetical protein J3K34DRAFT_434697 [Monoraphidium minutum]|nr:MAG: hypothetical protein J3K34DRAFT_434697 [Monoraphidium minutum]